MTKLRFYLLLFLLVLLFATTGKLIRDRHPSDSPLHRSWTYVVGSSTLTLVIFWICYRKKIHQDLSKKEKQGKGGNKTSPTM